MSRKVFISFLGTGVYDVCQYKTEEFASSETRFIQTAMLEQFAVQDWSEDDLVIILLTEKARRDNWCVAGNKRMNFRTKQEEEYVGLKDEMAKMNLKCQVLDLSIPDGNTKEEMFQIFNRLFEAIPNQSELHIDITHSFRYLPMLLLVFSNYSKFLKETQTKSISYGNHEAGDVIVDITSLSDLQDWTIAASDYLDFGNVDQLVKLSQNTLSPILREARGANRSASQLKKFIGVLKEMIDERQMCRGIRLVESETLQKVKEMSEEIDAELIGSQFGQIFHKIKDSLEEFDAKESVRNGFLSAKWCAENNLYQQASTILQECMITIVAQRMSLDWKVEKERDIVAIAYKVLEEENTDKWNLRLRRGATEEEKQERIRMIRKVFECPLFKSTTGIYEAVSNLRNDLNHAGFRNNPMKPDAIKDAIKRYIDHMFNELNKEEQSC